MSGPHLSVLWEAADDLLRVAKSADRAGRGYLAESLTKSNRTFHPMADPLSVNFGAHRWLSSEREESYSDWFAWILEQIGDVGRILNLLGAKNEALVRECASERPAIDREFPMPDGRLDLAIKSGGRTLAIVEIKTKPFDIVAVRGQLERYALWIQTERQPLQPVHCCFVAADLREFECPVAFEPLEWRELTLRMREQACEWIRASKEEPRNGSDLVRAAMTLAFCGAVEQNLLGLSGTPVMFRTQASAEYLKEWSAKSER
jgi:hypothetical protein